MAKKIRINESDNHEIFNNSNKIYNVKKDILKIVSISLNVAFIVAIIVIILSYNTKIEETNKKMNSIDTSCAYKSETSCKFNYLSEIDKAKFLDDNIVFVLEGYGNVYYTYDCVQKITDGEYSYWAYNIEAAKSQGYKKGKC